MLLHLPEPIGWLALTATELLAAQARATELLPPQTGNAARAALPILCAPRLLTADEAASALSVEATWLLRQAREGRIAHVRLGKYVRFDLDAIVGQCTKRPSVRP